MALGSVAFLPLGCWVLVSLPLSVDEGGGGGAAHSWFLSRSTAVATLEAARRLERKGLALCSALGIKPIGCLLVKSLSRPPEQGVGALPLQQPFPAVLSKTPGAGLAWQQNGRGVEITVVTWKISSVNEPN